MSTQSIKNIDINSVLKSFDEKIMDFLNRVDIYDRYLMGRKVSGKALTKFIRLKKIITERACTLSDEEYNKVLESINTFKF